MIARERRNQDSTDVQKELDEIRDWRRKRFRILVCIDGSDESYEGLHFASRVGESSECDIILLYVRPIDQGLRSGGLQVRVARENMLEWGLELPGITYLKKGLDLLVGESQLADHWSTTSTHTDVWSDPLGDNKIEYRHESGKSIVLKLKTAPDPASGILDQYELGPYNLMILGAPSRWRGEFKSFWDAGVVQKVAMLSPCSVLVSRGDCATNIDGKGHFICTDGTARSLDAVRREAVLASHCGSPISLFSVAPDDEGRGKAEKSVAKAKTMLEKIDIEVAETLTGVGDPTRQIIEAGADYSMIAVSDSEKNWFKRFLVGSVAFNVMGGAQNSVMNVR